MFLISLIMHRQITEAQTMTCVVHFSSSQSFICHIDSADVREGNRKDGHEMTFDEVGFTSSMKVTVNLNVVSEGDTFVRKQ